MLQNNNSGSPYQPNNEKLIDIEEVESYTLEDFGFTVDNVKMNHFGIDVRDPRTGEELPDEFYRSKLESAVSHAEKLLDIVILPRIEEEYHDFYRNDFESFMYLHAWRKPILQVENLTMDYGGYTVFDYPSRWLKVYTLPGHVEMLPSLLLSGENQGLNVAQIYSGYPMISGIPQTQGNNFAPQLFNLKYVAGMLPPSRRGVTKHHEMHPDLWQMIIKIALKEVLQQWGRLIIGAGIADMSTNIDGISQTIGTTQSATHSGASAEIIQLSRDIEELYQGLKSYYGFNLGLV